MTFGSGKDDMGKPYISYGAVKMGTVKAETKPP
jgi:hypothetical protein